MSGLLKFITCGSVDDGKSTLIGHILYDAKLLYADQKKALELESKVGSRSGAIDYSLLLDGLMAEREQGITIDVAYRYFTTDNRSFIVADTPGHEEYTRNMAVGASFAELAIILIDAKQGVLIQTKRHARICALMGIRYFVFAVNKMDLVNYDEARFREIEHQIAELTKELHLANVQIIPVSATEGDNITTKSKNIPWYKGEALLPYLEKVNVHEEEEEGFFLPVQRVCRPDHTFRGFQGQVESGTIKVGDKILALPNNEEATVKSILIGMKHVESAVRGNPVTIQLDREIDVSRGCVLTSGTKLHLSNKFTATLLWMDDDELSIGKEYVIKLGTKEIVGVLTAIKHKIDINTGEFLPADHLVKNEIALCELRLQENIVLDTFAKHKTLGELILIDRITNMTSACGVVETIQEGGNMYAFYLDNLKARGDVFEEFYYNMENLSIDKNKVIENTYTVGDTIPTTGESYHYPDSFDILVLRDKIAVEIRNKKITAIKPLAQYKYSNQPLVNGRGFAIQVHSAQEYDKFYKDFEQVDEIANAKFFEKWIKFETYRDIVFHDKFWSI